MAWNAAEYRGEGVGQRARGWRERTGASVGTAVCRGDPPVHRDAPAGGDRLARGTANPDRRTRAGRPAWPASRSLDGRPTRATRGSLAFGLRGAIHGDGRTTADAVPCVVAHAARLAPPVRRGSRGGGRRRRRLRIRSGVQPRVQEARGAGSRHVAKSHDTCGDQPQPLRYKVKSAHKQRIFLAASLPVFLIASSQATAQTKVTRSPAVPSAVR